MPVESLRWITFGHVEADECGSMNMWLAAAPHSQVAHGALGCDVSLNDLCDRPPRALAEGEVIDLGGKRVRQISTPHVPHGWEAQVLFEETTGTLLCGDLFSQRRRRRRRSRPTTSSSRRWPPRACSTPPAWRRTPRRRCGRSATWHPTTLAIMHGSSFQGDGKQALYDLAASYEALIVPA